MVSVDETIVRRAALAYAQALHPATGDAKHDAERWFKAAKALEQFILTGEVPVDFTGF